MVHFKPIHMTIRDNLLSKVRSGEYEPGDRLPSENELTKMFHASKSPVRQALDSLRKDGIIYSHPGRGTFVSNQEKWAWTIGGLQDLIGLGPQTRFELHDFTPDHRSPELDGIFKKKKGKFTRIEGIRISQDKPVCYIIVFLPDPIGRTIQVEDFDDKLIISAIEKKSSIRVNKCIQNISAVGANKEQAKILKIALKTPLLHIDRVYYDENEQIIEWARSFFRSDLIKYHAVFSKGKLEPS